MWVRARVEVGEHSGVAPRAARNLTVWIEGWRETIPAEVAALASRLPHGEFPPKPITTIVACRMTALPTSRAAITMAGPIEFGIKCRRISHAGLPPSARAASTNSVCFSGITRAFTRRA